MIKNKRAKEKSEYSAENVDYSHRSLNFAKNASKLITVVKYVSST